MQTFRLDKMRVERNILEKINDSKKYLLELGLGGTVVGICLNRPTDYRDVVIAVLKKM